jgi:hypothetical protein
MAGDWTLNGAAGRIVTGDVGAIVDLFVRGRVELADVAPELRNLVAAQAATRAHRERLAAARRLQQRAAEDAARVRVPAARDVNAWAKRFEP